MLLEDDGDTVGEDVKKVPALRLSVTLGEDDGKADVLLDGDEDAEGEEVKESCTLRLAEPVKLAVAEGESLMTLTDGDDELLADNTICEELIEGL